MSKEDRKTGLSQNDHLEAALSNATIRAGIDLNDRQWNTLCTVTRKELTERGVQISDRVKHG